MDWKTSLDWYCSGNLLDEEDLKILEDQYQHVIENIDLDNSFEVAPKHICTQTKVPEGSSWITAVAVVLDRLSPVKVGNSRSSVVDLLRRNQST